MALELKVPNVGESITEVQIGEWLKAVGDSVKQDEAIVMIETDKVTVELPAPAAGTLTQILIKAGSKAQVGDVVGYLEEGAGKGAERAAPAAGGEASKTLAPPAPSASAPAGREKQAGGEKPVMPSAARVLSEAGLSAGEVDGTGKGGRILKEDAQRAAANRDNTAPTPAAPAASSPAPARQGASQQGRQTPAPSADRDEEVVAMTTVRRRIAERLVEAQQTAAMLTTFNEVDMTEVMELRKKFQEDFVKRYDTKLGFMSFFVKASVDALKQFPAVNAEIRGTDIVYKNYYDIGVAVGGGKGLVVPVLRNAERLSFAEIEVAIKDLGARAQKNSLKLEELQGGTFTITNGGVYGSLLSTPILNPPQSGILGLHGIVDRPVALDGQVVIRPMMYIALTYDHRIVDGREAVTFLRRIKDAIEEPSRLLLEV